jgi:type 2 lantibiotic biosynthesis protein LanM
MNESRDSYLETANFLGRKICRDALWAGNRANWLGPAMEFTDGAWMVVHRAYGPDLYSGSSGIALFLAQLFKLTREKIYRITAEGGLAQAVSRLSAIPESGRIGCYSGWSGIAYSLMQAAEIFDHSQFASEALRIMESLRTFVASAQALDVISGDAGAIPVFLLFHRRYRKDFLLDVAVKHGDHLLSTARKSDIGWSWDTLHTPQDLTGFSHGTAGIGWALLELHRATGEERFREGAGEAFRYERHWYNPTQKNWPDFRTAGPSSESSTPVYAVSWCHGAPGIGLSRLRAWEITGEDMYRQEAHAAMDTTLRQLSGFHTGQEDFSLCHGVAGNAELLIQASRVFNDTNDMAAADRVGQLGIEWYRRNDLPWPCGVPGGGETPNLMLGLAGMGYFFLRLAEPSSVPSVLFISEENQAKAVH